MSEIYKNFQSHISPKKIIWESSFKPVQPFCNININILSNLLEFCFPSNELWSYSCLEAITSKLYSTNLIHYILVLLDTTKLTTRKQICIFFCFSWLLSIHIVCGSTTQIGYGIFAHNCSWVAIFHKRKISRRVWKK